MKNTLLLLAGLLLGSCAAVPDNPNAELAMSPGTAIEARTRQGTLRIEYVDRFTRRYLWDGYDKKFRHQPRRERWYGSLGMYRPRGDGSMHAVLEEGQQHFSSVDEAQRWLAKREKFMDYVSTRDGLVVGWKQQARPGDGYLALSVEVWQILIDGRKPKWPDASPSKIRVTTSPETKASTPAASTTRRTQGLTSGDFFASIGSFIKNHSFRERPSFALPQPCYSTENGGRI